MNTLGLVKHIYTPECQRVIVWRCRYASESGEEGLSDSGPDYEAELEGLEDWRLSLH